MPELAVFALTPALVESIFALNVPLVVYTSSSLYVVTLAACEVAPIKYNLLLLLVEPAVFLVSGGVAHSAVPSEFQPKNCPVDPPLGICLLPEVVGCSYLLKVTLPSLTLEEVTVIA